MREGMQEGVQELLNAAGTCAIVPVAASVTRADGHAYRGKVSQDTPRGIENKIPPMGRHQSDVVDLRPFDIDCMC
jgi:hypothetical protein